MTALTDGRRSWSAAELSAAARSASAELVRRGASPEATVAAVLFPSPETVVAIHAVLHSGALLAPLNPSLTAPELAAALAVLRPAVVLVDRERVARVGDAVEAAGIACAVIEPEGWAGAPLGPDPSPSDADPLGDATDRAAAVLWTSGTTGRPRGVLLRARALRHSALASAERLDLGPGDRWYASLGVAHVGGLALVTRAAVLGSTLVATGPFDPAELDRLIDLGEVTHASLVPTMLRRLLDERRDRPAPASLRCLLVGGAACPAPLLERALAAGLPVALTYGMTETTSQAATAPPDLVRRKPGTVGPPLPGVELTIDPAGEILVRGPVLAGGLVGGDDDLLDAGGWLHTGDLGDVDEDGHLWVTGRRSDRIVTGGVNVDPVEVEAVLLSHPDVTDAAVIGLSDPEWGERVVAAVVGTADTEALRGWARERLAGPKTPKDVVLVPSLPRNPNGKVDRRALRALLEGTR